MVPELTGPFWSLESSDALGHVSRVRLLHSDESTPLSQTAQVSLLGEVRSHEGWDPPGESRSSLSLHRIFTISFQPLLGRRGWHCGAD